ncbi:MAG: gliding motility lipoprotein GldH [Paludibacteraceae bacterium]|nr:gliding motility lipoprotein GldH [Paludibacteraceae bacterium]MBR1481284.1 gliding motility lipoprotein GldH [Paludibacteraceae bacterium]
MTHATNNPIPTVARTAIVLISLLLSACHSGLLHSEYHAVSPAGWHADSALTFTFTPADTLTPCDILLHVRHTGNYPYQNTWLFIETGYDSLPLTYSRDTIQFFLADDRGQWLGNGGNGWTDMPVLYRQQQLFHHAAPYTITVRHGMRDTLLRGITDIGLEIQRTN